MLKNNAGKFLSTSKSVGDCGAGGMIVLSRQAQDDEITSLFCSLQALGFDLASIRCGLASIVFALQALHHVIYHTLFPPPFSTLCSHSRDCWNALMPRGLPPGSFVVHMGDHELKGVEGSMALYAAVPCTMMAR